MGALTVKAVKENADAVLDFVEAELKRSTFPEEFHSDILVVTEEIFVNIANYAYEPGQPGDASIFMHISDRVFITFEDFGKPFNPHKNEDPDLDVPLMEREIGGLGVYFTKKIMDKVSYERADDKNILTIMKKK